MEGTGIEKVTLSTKDANGVTREVDLEQAERRLEQMKQDREERHQRMEQMEQEREERELGPVGASNPPIDHEKVVEKIAMLADVPFTSAEAKAALQEKVPDLDFTSLMIAYNIYIASETEQDAGDTLKHTATTIRKLAGIWAQPTLFDA